SSYRPPIQVGSGSLAVGWTPAKRTASTAIRGENAAIESAASLRVACACVKMTAWELWECGDEPCVEFGPRMGYTRRQGVARSAGPFPARRTIVKVGIALNMLTKEGLSDAAVLAEHMALGDLAEPLGFDSLFALEHHFTGYAMSPA